LFKINLISAFTITLLFASFSFSKAEFRISAGPIIKGGFGETEYIMDAFARDDENNLYRVKSQLEFPLDFFMAGVEASGGLFNDGREDFAGQIGIFTSINNPRGLMTDYDWSSPVGYPLVQWSYTESEVDLTSILLHLEGRARVFSWEKVSTYLYGGFRYQKIEQDILGYTGWQLHPDPPPDTVYFSEDIYALYYRVSYYSPMAGFVYKLDLSPTTAFDIRAAYTRFYVKDYDDHILRRKIGTASGWGNGIYSAVRFRTALIPDSKLIYPFLDISGEFSYLNATMPQTQEWYGDDPISDGDETGQIVTGIPHEISSMQFWFGIRFGLSIAR